MNKFNNENVYLKANFVAEACIAGWYAWPHLISPATVTLNLKNRLIPIMKDYIQNPDEHKKACSDPKMTGGPFIDLNGQKTDAVKNLLVETVQKYSKQIALADAFEKLDILLQQNASGQCMDELYEKIPAILRGYVELVYDMHNNPAYRIKESLLYRSDYYNKNMQSLLCYLIYDDGRPFVLSTPRLKDSGKLHLEIPFDHPGIDQLFEMTRTPRPYREIKNILGIKEEDDELFQSFFTQEAPDIFKKYDGDGARVRYFGHACILIETKDVSILLDPVISYGYDVDVSRLTYNDLPDQIDYVLITHNHQDHVLIETMLYLRHKVKNWVVPRNGSFNIVDPSLKLQLLHTGFKNVIALEELEELDFPLGKITGLPFYGEHGDLDIASKLGYFIQIKDFKILCLADSQNIEPKVYEHLHSAIGNVDVLFLGMECNGAPVSWMYGPYFPSKLEREKDESRRIAGSDYNQAIDIVNRFKVKEVYIYAMGMEPWIKFLSANIYTPECEAIVQSNILLKDTKENGIISERLYGEKEILSYDIR